MLRPQPLELTASDEMVALENINVLQQNGFEIDVDGEASVGQGNKLKLTAQPVSKNTTFDMKGGLNNDNIFWALVLLRRIWLAFLFLL